MTARVLLLNASFQPIKTISVKKAVSLMLKDKVETIEGVARRLQTPSTVFEVPSVLRLRVYVNVPHRKITWTKWRVLERDNYTCVYCMNNTLPRSQYTVDHIIPSSRGGKNNWGNTACACLRCNQRKADRTPTEAGMKLLFEPKTPRTNYLVLNGNFPECWKRYIIVSCSKF